MKLDITLSALSIMILACLTGFAQTQGGPNEDESKPRIVMRQYNDVSDKDRWEIDASYPELTLESGKPAEAFNRVAKDLVMKNVAEFKQQMNGLTDEERKFLPEKASYYSEIGYIVEYLSEEMISVGFGQSEYTGGAHPNHWSFALNYDLKNSRIIELGDLFKNGSNFLKVISQNSIEQIAAEQEEAKDNEWITGGAGEKIENFKNWNVTKEGLKFSFDPYQVGSYAAGSFETIVPYEKFSTDLHSPLFSMVSRASYIDGNPASWCRNGLFPKEDVKFRLASVKGKKGESKERTYFYKDDNDCPNGKNCRTNAYVIPGDELIVSRSYGDFVCAWYQPIKGSETVGWLSGDELNIYSNNSGPLFNKWLGNWESDGNSLNIVRGNETGSLKITGNAFWQGLGDNIHIGEVDDTGSPKGNELSIGGPDKYDCRVKMQLVGDLLVVSDNMMCGGVNVTFSGVYQKK